ncbi:MAG: hypothetical protein HLUCCO17_02550 [Saliniramus fredricksonii]|uniref:Uncharacterized protein n=1 Tax=Saliniramus fredricksonii TaxID=1653334 RepID=A0A0P7XAZ3_9HYPH|nr:hypothetical protein [Saliniramus fredricksonii]KPQ12468.1 MAG: hypothetical protein HLUCCO17_02550 [Saliniramus fredricksonii]SCC81369.1 hypothetical protein GA0071312_2307 [Saliniramus fredricksonii]
MSIQANHDKSSRFGAWLIAISAVILVGTEVIGVAAATAWAIGGLLQLGSILTWVLGAILCAGAGWVTWVFARNAWRLESEACAAPPIASGPRD